jgi:hypothetical protein
MSEINVTEENYARVGKELQKTVTLREALWVDNAEIILPMLTNGTLIGAYFSSIINAPALKIVDIIHASFDATIIAPVLTKAARIKVHNSTLILPALTSVIDTLDVRRNSTVHLPALTNAGHVKISGGADFNLSTLVTAESILVDEGSNLDLPALADVGCVSICNNSTFNFPSLRRVKGDLYIDTTLDLDAERKLWELGQHNRWVITDRCSVWLRSQMGNITHLKTTRKMPYDGHKKYDKFYNGNFTDKQYIRATMGVMNLKGDDSRHNAFSKIHFERPFNFMRNYRVLSEKELCNVILFFNYYTKSTGGAGWKALPFSDLVTEDDFKVRALGLLLSGGDDDKTLYKKALAARAKLEVLKIRVQNGFTF